MRSFINFKLWAKVKRAKSHMNGYAKPPLHINYDHLAKVLEAKHKVLKSS